jgi:citrate lyase subunit beta / citryl-CoA lyase
MANMSAGESSTGQPKSIEQSSSGPRLTSMLYAPANRPDLVAKMSRYAPDAVVIDLEDGTPLDAKITARSTATKAAIALKDDGFTGSIWLRSNAPADEHFPGDLETFVAGRKSGAFDGLVVAKIESAQQVRDIESRLSSADVGASADSAAIVWGIETVRGTQDCVEVLAASRFGVAAYFGAEDFIADLGGQRTNESLESLYARSRVSIACRLAGMAAIDQVTVAVDDGERFLRDSRVGASLGYVGKNCIHPSQVDLSVQAYLPSPEAVGRAHRLVECYELAVASGLGTANFEGQMIDTPLVTQAMRILDRSR